MTTDNEKQNVQLCVCTDKACKKPHTVLEAEKQTEEKPYCPVCKNNDNTYPYEYEGVAEVYCNGCFNSFTANGEIIVTDNEIVDEVIEHPTKHLMVFDTNVYECDTCNFETIWLSEANQHELTNDGGPSKPIVTKPDTPKVEMHYTKWRDKDTWYCIYCPAIFNDFNKALAHENDAGKKANQNSYTTVSAHCKHKPQEVLKSEQEGWSIWAGRKWDCEDSLNDFDIVLNLSGTRVSKRHEIPIKALKKWESKEKYTEICLDWPDRGTVTLPKQWWTDLLNHLKQNKLRMLVFCVGGHGRTGTAICSLLITAFGWEPKEACSWIWENYCEEAIESNAQIQYCYNLVGQTYIPPAVKTEKNSANQTALITGWDND